MAAAAGTGGCSIVWFRRDLRLEDNPALVAAARVGSVIPVFIWCPAEDGQFHPGRVSRWWLKQSLMHLHASLTNLGSPLIMRKAPHNTLSVLLDIVEATGATQVFLNHLYGEWTHHLPELILSSLSLSLCVSVCVSLCAALDFGPQHISSFPRVFFAKCSASVSECPLTEK
jgi:deoxyribodipyrimidine photolyase